MTKPDSVRRLRLWEREIEPAYIELEKLLMRVSPATKPSDLTERAELYKLVFGAVVGDLKCIAETQDPAWKVVPMSQFADKILSNFIRSCERHERRQKILDKMLEPHHG